MTLSSLLLGLLVAATDALGAAPDAGEQLEALSAEVDALATAADVLEVRMERDRASLTQSAAEERFDDALLAYLTGSPELAATKFHALVTLSPADTDSHRDARWYLADALTQMGSYELAAGMLSDIADDDAHPFRQDAVARLLELYAIHGNAGEFEDYMAELEAAGTLPSSDLVAYTLGKVFLGKGDLQTAQDWVIQVEPGTDYWHRSKYVHGAIRVAGDDLDGARRHFEENLDMEVIEPEHRLVRDASILALGRIAYEQADYTAAAEFYDTIDADSELLADKLHELVWSLVKQGDHDLAVASIDIFQLRFPAHAYTVQLELLRGHLLIRADSLDPAVQAYGRVMEELGPTWEAIEARQGTDPTLPAEIAGSLAEPGSRTIPEWVIGLLREEPDVARTLSVYDALNTQAADLLESEAIVRELDATLNSKASLGRYHKLRVSAWRELHRILESRLTLLELEAEATKRGGPEPAAVSTQVAVLSKRADQVVSAHDTVIQRSASLRNKLAMLARQRVPDLPPDVAAALAAEEATTLASLEAIDGLGVGWQEHRAITVAITEGHTTLAPHRATAKKVNLASIDAMRADLDTIEQRFFAHLGDIDAIEAQGRPELRAQLDDERARLAVMRSDHATTMASSLSAWPSLTHEGFATVGSAFDTWLAEASIGLVDGTWGQLSTVMTQRLELLDQREDAIADLAERFDYMRRGLETRTIP